MFATYGRGYFRPGRGYFRRSRGRIDQAEYSIHILVAASQEYVTAYSGVTL